MNECKLIGDVMPLFAEGLTSPETDSFVKEHLRSCSRCRAVFGTFVPDDPREAAANGEAASDEARTEANPARKSQTSPSAERADTTPADDKTTFVRLVRRRAVLRLAAIAAAVAVLSGGTVCAVGLATRDDPIPASVTADIPGFGELSGELTDTRTRGGDTTAFYTCADGSALTYANGTLCSVTLAGESLIETGAEGTLTEEDCRAIGEAYVRSLGADLDGYVPGATRTTDAGREFVYTRAIDETHRGTVRFGVTFGGDVYSWSIFPNRELICPDDGSSDPLLETDLPGGAISLESLSGRTSSRICYDAPVYLEGTTPGKDLSANDLRTAADRLCAALCGKITPEFRTGTPAGILDGTQITRYVYELPSGDGGAQIELLPDGGAVMWIVSMPQGK